MKRLFISFSVCWFCLLACRPAWAQASPQQQFTIERGQTIAQAIENWAQSAGWVIEQPEISWVAPVTTQFNGTFQEVIIEVTTLLVAQGADIQLHLWPESKYGHFKKISLAN